ncbi:MAG: hypothetical protein JO166_05930 [Deltaproteobacteria bacterium]|nr:hypothetical protein [Deltaproteobacteria bacterium]
MLIVLACSAAEASISIWFGALLGLQAIFYGAALLGLSKTLAGRPAGRFTAVPFYIVLGVLGALVGVVEAIVGKRFDIWEIPVLSRGIGEAAGPRSATAEGSD